MTSKPFLHLIAMHVQAKLTGDIENHNNVSGSMHADLLELSSEDVDRLKKPLHCLQEKLASNIRHSDFKLVCF